MRVILCSMAAAVLLAVAAMYVLESSVQQRADLAYSSSPSVRGPGHGTTHNLVGKDWYEAKEH